MKRAFLMSLAAMLVFALVNESQAVLVQTQIFSETFDTNTPDLAATQATYPDFSGFGGNANIRVVGNQLEIQRGVNNYFHTNQTFNEEIWVTADMGGFGVGSSNGQYATALVIGNRAFQFFPGCCGGALRIYDFNPLTGAIGTNVATLTTPPNSSNIIMPGFTPSDSVMHHIKLYSNNLGVLDLEFTDGSNPLNVYTQSFDIPGFIPGAVGFAAFHGGNISMFDNLTISALREEIIPAPEPTSAAIFGLGGVLLLGVTRSRRRKQAEGMLSSSAAVLRQA